MCRSVRGWENVREYVLVSSMRTMDRWTGRGEVASGGEQWQARSAIGIDNAIAFVDETLMISAFAGSARLYPSTSLDSGAKGRCAQGAA